MLATNQKTINKPIKLNGVGLHSGVNAELIIKPAPENFGIKYPPEVLPIFRKMDHYD